MGVGRLMSFKNKLIQLADLITNKLFSNTNARNINKVQPNKAEIIEKEITYIYNKHGYPVIKRKK